MINLLQLMFWMVFGVVLIAMDAYSILKVTNVGDVLHHFKRFAAKLKR